MSSVLAINGGSPVIKTPKPHFKWPPHVPGMSKLVAEYIESGQPLSIADRSGIYAELEDGFSGLLERRYAIVMSSGTMALYSAFFALDLKPGDEVISTVYSFHATASPLLHLGVKVIFCDVENDTGNIDTLALASLVTQKTRAVVTNHMWGHPVDVDAVKEICTSSGAAWVEDCSHAHFSSYKGRYVGTESDVAVFSLQGNKLISGGEGGILLTDSRDIYEKAVLLGHSLKRPANCVKSPQWHDLLRTGFGLKLRMHPLAAVMISHVLKNYCFDWIDARHETLARFANGLAVCGSGEVMPMEKKEYVTSMGAHYGFKPRVDFSRTGFSRRQIVAALQAEGADVSVPGSKPFHQIALFDHDRFPIAGFEKYDQSRRQFPGAEAYTGSILSVPTFTFKDQWPLVDQYIEAFDKVFSNLEELG